MPLFYPRLTSWMILILMGFQAFPQEKLLSDIQLIRDVRTGTAGESGSPRSYVYDQNTSPVQKYNPLNAAFGGLLFVYQNVLSPQFSAHCLYAPSCSEFSKRSIQKYGLLKGLLLSADRVMRCNRMAATGIHPLRIQNNKASDPVDFYQMNP